MAFGLKDPQVPADDPHPVVVPKRLTPTLDEAPHRRAIVTRAKNEAREASVAGLSARFVLDAKRGHPRTGASERIALRKRTKGHEPPGMSAEKEDRPAKIEVIDVPEQGTPVLAAAIPDGEVTGLAIPEATPPGGPGPAGKRQDPCLG
jgi:hypothetical protein